MGLALRGLVLLGLLAASYQRSRPTHYENSFATGDELELRVYLSPQLRFNDFNNSAALIWHATGLRYDMSSAGNIETTVQVNVTEHMLNNGSMYCHSFFTKAGKSPDPKALGSYDRWSSTHTVMSMIAHGERLKPIGLYNLLTGEPAPWEAALRRAADEAAAAGEPEGQFIPYWKPKMHLQLVVDTVPFPLNAMPNMIHNALHQSGLMHGHRYRPFVYVNELTVMRNHWVAVNASAPSVPLEVSAKPQRLNNPNPNPNPHPHPNPNPNPNPKSSKVPSRSPSRSTSKSKGRLVEHDGVWGSLPSKFPSTSSELLSPPPALSKPAFRRSSTGDLVPSPVSTPVPPSEPRPGPDAPGLGPVDAQQTAGPSMRRDEEQQEEPEQR